MEITKNNGPAFQRGLQSSDSDSDADRAIRAIVGEKSRLQEVSANQSDQSVERSKIGSRAVCQVDIDASGECELPSECWHFLPLLRGGTDERGSDHWKLSSTCGVNIKT